MHISALMAMFVSVWICGDLGTQKDFIMMNMKSKSKMTAVMLLTGFHSNHGVLEMLVNSRACVVIDHKKFQNVERTSVIYLAASVCCFFTINFVFVRYVW